MVSSGRIKLIECVSVVDVIGSEDVRLRLNKGSTVGLCMSTISFITRSSCDPCTSVVPDFLEERVEWIQEPHKIGLLEVSPSG